MRLFNEKLSVVIGVCAKIFKFQDLCMIPIAKCGAIYFQCLSRSATINGLKLNPLTCQFYERYWKLYWLLLVFKNMLFSMVCDTLSELFCIFDFLDNKDSHNYAQLLMSQPLFLYWMCSQSLISKLASFLAIFILKFWLWMQFLKNWSY